MMYNDLIKMMRHCSNTDAVCGVTDVCPFYDKAEEDSGYYFCVERMMRKAADAIEELWKLFQSAEKDNAKLTAWYVEKCNKHKWIPVTERLPEDRQRVLVFYWLNLKPKEPWHKVCYFASKLNKVDKYDFDGCNYPGFYDCDSEYGYYQLSDVTHWMPLPDPPKDGES